MHEDWLRESEKAGRKGLSANIPAISRGREHKFTLNMKHNPSQGNWTSGTFTCTGKAEPDAPGAPLVTWSVSVGTPIGDITPVTFTLAPGVTTLPKGVVSYIFIEALYGSMPILSTRVSITGAV